MSSNRVSTRGISIRAALGLMVVVLSGLAGCNSYPPVKSREGRQLIKRLYVACNVKSEQKLTGVAEELSKLAKAGTITTPEKQAFDSIISLARDGKWEAAEKASLELADGQIGHEVPAEESP